MAAAVSREQSLTDELIGDERFLMGSLPYGSSLFSIKKYPVVLGRLNFGLYTGEVGAHGGQRRDNMQTRATTKSYNEEFNTSVLSTTTKQAIVGRRMTLHEQADPPKGGGQLIVVRTIKPEYWAPGLSTLQEEDNAPVSNFVARPPTIAGMLTEVENQRLLARGSLLELANKVNGVIETLDDEWGLDYSTEPTSLPNLVERAGFQKVQIYTHDNFSDGLARILHTDANTKERRSEKSDRLFRECVDGHFPFQFYGLWMYWLVGGGLPIECTVSYHHRELFRGYIEDKGDGMTYSMYDKNEKLDAYNLLHPDNYRDIEERIGVLNGYLDPNGKIIPGRENAWEAYRHNPNEAIQILRHAIFNPREITHIRISTLMFALGYPKGITVDGVCNCPEDPADITTPIDAILDTQDVDTVAITSSELATFKDQEAEWYEDRRLQQIALNEPLYRARTHLKQARAEAAAASAAVSVEDAMTAARAAEAEASVAMTEAHSTIIMSNSDSRFINDPFNIRARKLSNLIIKIAQKAAADAKADASRKRSVRTATTTSESAPSKSKKAGSRKLRKRTTIRRKKIMRKTKKRTYRKKSQKRNNRK